MTRLFQKGHCWVCGAPLREPHRGGECCSRRECRGTWAQYEEETELKFLVMNSRWSGGPGFKEEPLEEYLRDRMDEAMRRLPHSADVLAEVLIEILESLIDGCDKRLVSVI
jgi:hypothetical protein